LLPDGFAREAAVTMTSAALLGTAAALTISVNSNPHGSEPNLPSLGFGALFIAGKQVGDAISSSLAVNDAFEDVQRAHDGVKDALIRLNLKYEFSHPDVSQNLKKIEQSLDFFVATKEEKTAFIGLLVLAVTGVAVIGNAAAENNGEGQLIGWLFTLLTAATLLNVLAKSMNLHLQKASEVLGNKRADIQKYGALLAPQDAV
jgi:hypothetical protein